MPIRVSVEVREVWREDGVGDVEISLARRIRNTTRPPGNDAMKAAACSLLPIKTAGSLVLRPSKAPASLISMRGRLRACALPR